jgi:hypothetical protein
VPIGMSGHPRIARALIVLASAALVLAVVVGYVQRAALNSEQFANRATAALRDDSVRTLIAERITDEVVLRNEADLIAARPVIQSFAAAIVGSPAFGSLFRSAVVDLHRAVFSRDRDTVTLTVVDVGTVLAAALEKLRPSLAREVSATDRVALLRRDLDGTAAEAARIADDVRMLALILFVVTLVLAVGAVAVAPDRRWAVSRLGVGAAAGGVAIVVAYAVARSVALASVSGADERAAAGAVWNAFLADLRTTGWILAGSGAVVAAAAASLIAPVAIEPAALRAARWVTAEPARPALRAARAVGLIAAGLLVIVQRDAVIQVLVTLAGVYLIYKGVEALLRLVYRPGTAVTVTPSRRILRHAGVTAGAAALIAGAVALFVGGGGTSQAAPAIGGCNGSETLCDRSLTEVVLPATHNSMSVPLPGWYSSEQDRPIAGQLDDGIRGLLIDTHYADRLPNGRLRTYFGSQEELDRQAAQDGVSADAVDAAQRIRDRLGFSGQGERGMYLCHTFCELGATTLADALDAIHDFLVTHPNDVVVAINQDYVTPKDFVHAVQAAGLGDLVFQPPASGAWPTLREMIRDNRRVVFLAENHAGGAPWYQPAYAKITEETPYTFKKVAQLVDAGELAASCRPNRGPSSAPSFLINHWISTDPVPLPSNAAKVNAYEPLLRRARTCQRIRDHLPNLLAVNFYRRGDLFKVVETLNGLR